MKKLGIIGGTFNPVHNGHLALAQAAYDEYELDKVMFLPNFQPPHKNCGAAPCLRLEMTRAAVEETDHFFVSDFEINKGGISYSADTFKAFREMYHDTELYFIIGGDSLRDFPKWYKPHEIVKNCILLVYPRNDINLDDCISQLYRDFRAKAYKLNAPSIEISSSQIRGMINEGKRVDAYVPPNVLEIIKRNNLYKG